MNDILRPETNTRNTQKCSACRQAKKKCIPDDRDWENSQQKCDLCEKNNRPCGPNLKYSEDPVYIQQHAVVPENEYGVGSSRARERLGGNLDASAISSAQNPPAPTPRRIQGGDDVPPSPYGFEDGRRLFGACSVKDLEEKARSKLSRFYALGKTLAYASQPLDAYCHADRHQQPYHDLSTEDKLHTLFQDIHRIAVEFNSRDEPHLAEWTHSSLVSALDRYPRLFDNRKRHFLLEIAVFFQKLGHQWEYEHVLQKIASIPRVSDLPSLFPRLAESLSISSQSISCVLRDYSIETLGGDDIDPNLKLPPLHAAVQHRQPDIIKAMFSNPNRARVNIEERDLNGWTALFAAVANGDESCCRALLENHADVDTRDKCGRTALEVAVSRGSLNIVKCLIEYNAVVNPNNTGCSSLPLHVAIENVDFNLEIISHLLNSGADVYLGRYAGRHTDGKHAIKLAEDRGQHQLAENMRQIPIPEPTPFLLPGYPMA